MICPLLYEINTRCWLAELTKKNARPATLADIPQEQFIEWQRLGFTHVWLMGVWTMGPRARTVALQASSRQEYSDALPDLREDDIGASPYAIADYSVSPALGGDPALRQFRNQLNRSGLKLLLDFVPNHVGLDHRWLKERPEVFVQGRGESPETFPEASNQGRCWLAHGKDPYFAPWSDTVQLDYRRADTRATMIEVLKSIAGQCDGVRCDMAMLLLNDVFTKTWERFPVIDQMASIAQSEFWPDAISTVKKSHPAFLFLAEAYWGLESRLQALGFDFTYDKVLCDCLIARHNAEVQRHLLETSSNIIAAGAHFLENHDEKRIAALLSPQEHRAAAFLILALPGMRFLHDGQLTGAHLKVPVQLLRRPSELAVPEIQLLYEQLLAQLKGTAVGRGRSDLIRPREAWPGNPTAQNIMLVQWQDVEREFDLAVVNLATHPSQCFAPINLPNFPVQNWSIKDLLGEQNFTRNSADMIKNGLYLDIPAHGAQLLHFRAIE